MKEYNVKLMRMVQHSTPEGVGFMKCESTNAVITPELPEEDFIQNQMSYPYCTVGNWVIVGCEVNGETEGSIQNILM